MGLLLFILSLFIAEYIGAESEDQAVRQSGAVGCDEKS